MIDKPRIVPLLTEFKSRTVNLHLGLSPYYRGSATNFWPLVYGQPECVGATIHLATSEIDGGPILAQVRPTPDTNDGPHELGCKAIVAASDVLPSVLSAFARGTLSPRPQSINGGRLFRKRDFNADAVRKLHRNMDAGLMRDFVEHADERRARFPIVEVSR